MARARNPRGQGDQLRSDLLAAADALLDETGDPARVTVRGLASAVGVAPNAVYLHFADRDALLAEIAIDRFAVCTADVRAAVAGIDDPQEVVLRGHERYCELALERPGHYRLLFGDAMAAGGPEQADRVATAGLAYFQVCVDGCTGLSAAGVTDAEPAVLAGAIWALQHGWCEIALARHLGRRLLPPPRVALALLLFPTAH